MGNRLKLAAALVALTGAFAVAALSLAGSGNERREAGPVVAESITPNGEMGAAARGAKKRKPKIATFYSQERTLVPATGILQPVKCPRGEGSAIGAGARTEAGITISYLSRAMPDGRSPNRSFVIGLDDVSDTNAEDVGAYVEVQCAKRIAVR